MPYEINFPRVPGGYALTSALTGEQVSVAIAEFSSSEDGDEFIQRLEGLPEAIIRMLPGRNDIRPSTVDHLLVLIRSDGSATAYINELSVKQEVRVNRPLEKGDLVFEKDIVDIEKRRFENVEIPANVGVLYLFSVGWRKGLYYDFAPIQPDGHDRPYDLDVALAEFFTYLKFQDLYKMTEQDWSVMLDQMWFPFISLRPNTRKQIVTHCKNKWNIDELMPTINEELVQRLNTIIERLERNDYFLPQVPFVEVAVKRYLDEDFVSAISVLYPRLEGLMRTFQQQQAPHDRTNQKQLVKTTIDAGEKNRHRYSLLLPQKFRQYLTEVYFANFEPAGHIPLSRNSVAHGVVDSSHFSRKGAAIAFLVLEQMLYFLRPLARGDT